MNCQKFEQWIVLSLEGEVTSRQKYVLEKHLKECAECREVLEDYRSVRHLFSTLPLEPIPVLFWPVTEKRKTPSLVSRRIVLVPAAFAVCLLLVVGIIKFRNAPLSVPVQNSSSANLLAGVSEREFFDVNFPNSTDYRYFIENLSVEEQETFFNILKEM